LLNKRINDLNVIVIFLIVTSPAAAEDSTSVSEITVHLLGQEEDL
jgi:hypothetical protein